MKTFLKILFYLILNGCCVKAIAQQKYTNEIFMNPKDTLIYLNDTLSLYFASYNKEMKLWYNLYIIKNRKKTKLVEGNDYPGFGSELGFSLSPNAKYLVLDGIIKDYVYESDTDSTLHENYMCGIIDLEKVKTVMQMQEDCDGEWNNNNQWISGSKIVFDSNDAIKNP